MSAKSIDLRRAYKTEKDSRLKIRLQAVCNFLENDKEISEIAELVMCSENSVRRWIKRFDEAGIDGLRDLPRSGREPNVYKDIFYEILEEFSPFDINPINFRQTVLDYTGTEYSMCQIRRILRWFGFSKRKRQSTHVNNESPASVRAWQWYCKNIRFPRLKKKGFTTVIADEAFFVQNKHDTSTWGITGTRTISKYLGDHARVPVFGSIAENGNQLFLTFSKNFGSEEFIFCLEALRRRHGKVAVLCDRWIVHKSNDVKEYLKDEPDVKLIYLPKGSPYLNLIEQCWHDGKRDILGTTIYRKLGEMKAIIGQYYRTASFRHRDMYKYLYRSPEKALNYL